MGQLFTTSLNRHWIFSAGLTITRSRTSAYPSETTTRPSLTSRSAFAAVITLSLTFPPFFFSFGRSGQPSTPTAGQHPAHSHCSKLRYYANLVPQQINPQSTYSTYCLYFCIKSIPLLATKKITFSFPKPFTTTSKTKHGSKGVKKYYDRLLLCLSTAKSDRG